MKKLGKYGIAAFLVLFSTTACSDFIAAPESDPNAVPNATVDQLFTAAQVKSFLFNGGELSRFSSVFMQQNDGVARQWATIASYVVGEGDFDFMNDMYTGGGLIDLRKAQQRAEEAGRRPYAGILKIHEAWMFGLGASMWGALPYSEAADPDIENPALDSQESIYSALQSLLDEAIADLQAGGSGPGSVDFQFGGDAASWIAVAHTLKARLHMHWVEVDGGSRYQAAKAEAEQGIQSASGNWHQVHSTSRTESNPWFLFQENRAGDVQAGRLLIDLMNGGTPADFSDDDPRLSIYFAPDGGQFVGSPPGQPSDDPGGGAADMAMPQTPAYPQPILTCAENQFILAEAEFGLGNEAAAKTAAKDGLACQEAWFASLGHSIDLSEQAAAIDAASGQELLEEIMAQKFIALYLVAEVWNDYKRTCLPAKNPPPGIPDVIARLLYSPDERETNTNVPPPEQQPERNANDPQGCN